MICSERRAVASLSLPDGEDKDISSIFPHFPVCSLIFPQSFFNFVPGSPTREGPGYVTVRVLSTADKSGCGFLQPLEVENQLIRKSQRQVIITTVDSKCNERVAKFCCCLFIQIFTKLSNYMYACPRSSTHWRYVAPLRESTQK